MKTIELHCHVGVGPKVSGEALVTDDNFSARYDLDRIATLSVTKIIHVVILSPIRFGVAEVDVVAPEPQGLDKFCSGKLL